MIGIDTNILVRYLTQDDEAQAQLAAKLIQSYIDNRESIFVNNIVFCELIWVLERGYNYTSLQVATVIRSLLSIKEFKYENHEALWSALYKFEKEKTDFSDALISELDKSNGCEVIYSFDQKSIKTQCFVSAYV